MSSIQSKIFYSSIRLFKIRKLINKAAESKNRRDQHFFSPKEKKKYDIFTTTIDQKEVSIMGKNRETHRHVIYFHGGMYVAEANNAHKQWLVKLFRNTDCELTYVDYPLAPEHKYPETVEMVLKSYQFLINQYPDDDFILMGDSAGGGLALVLAQYLRDHHLKKAPVMLILYSPWVRLDMNNPQIHQFVPKDVILDLDLLQKSARAYAGNTELTHGLLSPYYRNCQDLGDIHVFYGGDELLAPDIALLKQKCEEENAKASFTCYQGMGHVFQLFTFLPESQDVLRRTIEIISHQ
jgi:monoterpene epsilon-lactone hydrolase